MIEIESTLRDFQARLDAEPDRAQLAARLAINDTALFARRRISKRMREEVNFKRGDLTEQGGKLGVRKYATQGDLEALVSGRERPTSLARFRAGPVRFGRQKGVAVRVLAQGGRKKLERGFFMRLRRGNKLEGDAFNTGLAVRLKKGEKLSNSIGAVDIGGGVYLLYGPAVDQVFENYSADEIDAISDKLQYEFNRQYERLGKE